jgi:hypothetical protein
MVDEYTFYNSKYMNKKGAKKWVCSFKSSKRCIAYLYVSNGEASCIRNQHNHPPPKFHKTLSEKYIKI